MSINVGFFLAFLARLFRALVGTKSSSTIKNNTYIHVHRYTCTPQDFSCFDIHVVLNVNTYGVFPDTECCTLNVYIVRAQDCSYFDVVHDLNIIQTLNLYAPGLLKFWLTASYFWEYQGRCCYLERVHSWCHGWVIHSNACRCSSGNRSPSIHP